MSADRLTKENVELPEGWIRLAMNDIGRWFGGGTPSKANPRFWTGGNIPWVSPKDMKSSIITGAQDYITEDAVAQSASNLVEAGSVLIVGRSGILQHTLPVAVTQRQIALNQDLKAITPRENVRADYLALALKAFEREILHNCTKTGTTVQSLAFPAFLRFQIPIAPFQEQKRIVAEVEKQFTRLEAGITALRRVYANLKRYRDAIIKAACEGRLVPTEAELSTSSRLTRNALPAYETGEQLLERVLAERRQHWAGRGRYKEPAAPDKKKLGPLPKGWTWATILQLNLANRPCAYGVLQPGIDTDGGVPFVRVGNINDGKVDPANLKRVSHAIATQYPRTKLQGGEFVITLVGAIGRTAIIPDSLAGGNVARAVGIVPLSKTLNPHWVEIWFRNPRKIAEMVSKSHAVAQKTLNLEDVREATVALPPIAEQTRIVEEVERQLSVVEELQSLASANLKRATQLRRSILRKAFSGNLVPQDPHDEPADLLYERVCNQPKQAAKMNRPKRGKKLSQAEQELLPMKMFEDSKSALKSVLLDRPRAVTASELFEAGHFEREQVYSFYDAIADSPEAIKRLSAELQTVTAKSHREQKTQEAPSPLRLHELWVKKFKNLEDYLVTFDPQHALDVFLGWNGTGKSNLFEVLIAIFSDLYKWQIKDKWSSQDGLEGYRIRYEMDGRLIEICWDVDARRPTAKSASQHKDKTSEPDFQACRREEIPLPHFIFGYYSGPSNRFAELFSEHKRDHYDRLLKQKTDDEDTLADLLKQRRFFNAETHHAKYALLSFFYQDDPNIHLFLKKHLRIEDLESVLFVLKRPQWHRNNNPEDFWGATGLLRPVMERLRTHSIAPMVLPQTVDEGFQQGTRDHYFLLLPNKQHLQALASEYADPTSFFVALESTDFSSIIHEVRIRVRISATSTKRAVVTFKEMSEGEQQLLMVLGLLRFTKMSQSLVLLDEPDTHLNPHWQLGYLYLLLEALVGKASDRSSSKRIPLEELEKRLTSQVLLSTHDPLAIAGLLKQNIHLLKRGDKTEKCLTVRPDEDPRGMGFTGILTSEMFGLKSDLDDETLSLLDEYAALAGKESLSTSDKKNLQKMTSEVERLGFKSASSDPYYRAYLQALARRREARDIFMKPTWNKADIEALSKETDEILQEIEQENISK